MSVRNLVEALIEGDTVTAEAELTSVLNDRSEQIKEAGRQFVLDSLGDASGANE